MTNDPIEVLQNIDNITSSFWLEDFISDNQDLTKDEFINALQNRFQSLLNDIDTELEFLDSYFVQI